MKKYAFCTHWRDVFFEAGACFGGVKGKPKEKNRHSGGASRLRVPGALKWGGGRFFFFF